MAPTPVLNMALCGVELLLPLPTRCCEHTRRNEQNARRHALDKKRIGLSARCQRYVRIAAGDRASMNNLIMAILLDATILRPQKRRRSSSPHRTSPVTVSWFLKIRGSLLLCTDSTVTAAKMYIPPPRS